MKTDLNTITAILRKNLEKYKQDYNVLNLELFGSFVRNQQNKNSDLDILVSFSEPPSIFKFIELEEKISTTLKLKVDLVMKSSLKHNIGQRILEEAFPI
jgi:hypothetical protein